MKKKDFDALMEAVGQSIEYQKGAPVKGARLTHISVPGSVNVKSIRQKLGMTQQEFSQTFGFTLGGVRKWESGERNPMGPARVLLHMIGKDPKTVLTLASE